MIDMFRKKPVLKYESGVEVYPNIVTPAKNHVPDWYKKEPKLKDNETFDNHGIKHCAPLLDSFISGYMIVLPNDLYVKNNNGEPNISWRYSVFPPQARKSPNNLNLIPTGHSSTEFVWHAAAATSVPVGYSMLYTHPLNRHDLPFTTLSGVIDGGFTTSVNGNIPFFIKKDFEGIIHQGTPIIQIIPYCQENWISKETKGLVKKGLKNDERSSSVASGWYKKTFWAKKQYD